MRPFRIILTAPVILLMLLSQSQSALAGPATHFSVRLENVTIPWFFPPPDGLSSFCGEIPEGVHINPDDLGSNRVQNAVQNISPDGTQHVVITDRITGTATDNSGNKYKFVYQNVRTFNFDGSIVTAHMMDTFQLKGGPVNFTVGFNWSWAYEASSFSVVSSPVDIGVDPLFFATSDGVTEDPNIVPGSWQKRSTRGDPWNCDPL